MAIPTSCPLKVIIQQGRIFDLCAPCDLSVGIEEQDRTCRRSGINGLSSWKVPILKWEVKTP